MGQSKPINTHNILLVEDEAIIRFELADFFSDAGYEVFEAGDADEAIAILERETSIRVVLTDIQLPGSMDGLKLAHYVRDRYPPTVLLVTSGAAHIASEALPLNTRFITKPFDPARLLQQIDQMTR
ncbi:Response regulator receiver domain-containing protein [Rhizobium sp. NFR07]|uniref:response regulator n=1 Tax=Rhizobium sp. NFR07 TaxID=1566262 RepID=UPI0008EF4ED4|nr:response regulator [Rhizobium sp. NFR07]SFB59471.1 Response regulator receiver domain-containing protein [Rhizobium sp. NFR07]